MNGKGDRQRPVDKETYDKNYEEIDWSKTKKCSSCKKEYNVYHEDKELEKRCEENNIPIIEICSSCLSKVFNEVKKEYDPSEYDCLNEWKRKTRRKNRSALYNSVEKYKLEGRTKWINEGSVIIDDKYYYYCQSKKARVKGSNKYYKMRGFSHFYDTFLGNKNEK